MKVGLTSIFFAAVFLSAPAYAQVFIPPFNFTPQMYNGVYDHIRHRQKAESASSVDKLSTKTSDVFRYTRSAANSGQIIENYLNKIQPANPLLASQIRYVMTRQDIIAQTSKAIAPAGLQADNVADVFAMWWISAWRAANSDTAGAASGKKLRAVRAQVAQILLSSGALLPLSNIQKQEMAETMIIQTFVTGFSESQAKGDSAKLANIRQEVMQMHLTAGLDLTSIKLTENGFVSAR